MIHSFVFNEGKLVGRDLELEALRLVGADKGLILWVDLDDPTEEETKAVLENVFQFHPLAIEDCLTPAPTMFKRLFSRWAATTPAFPSKAAKR